MNCENSCSDLGKAFRDSKAVNLIDLDTLREKEPIWTIVTVKERGGKPYVLLGNEDDLKSRIWIEFNGEDKKTLTSYFEWMESGRKLFESKQRSSEELDYLRKVVIATGIVSGLINDEEWTKTTFQTVTILLATRWYHADDKTRPSKPELAVQNEDFNPYIQLTIRYITMLTDTVSSVTEQMKQVTKDK